MIQLLLLVFLSKYAGSGAGGIPAHTGLQKIVK